MSDPVILTRWQGRELGGKSGVGGREAGRRSGGQGEQARWPDWVGPGGAGKSGRRAGSECRGEPVGQGGRRESGRVGGRD